MGPFLPSTEKRKKKNGVIYSASMNCGCCASWTISSFTITINCHTFNRGIIRRLVNSAPCTKKCIKFVGLSWLIALWANTFACDHILEFRHPFFRSAFSFDCQLGKCAQQIPQKYDAKRIIHVHIWSKSKSTILHSFQIPSRFLIRFNNRIHLSNALQGK